MMDKIENFLSVELFWDWDVFEVFFVHGCESFSIDVVEDEVVSVVVEVVCLGGRFV